MKPDQLKNSAIFAALKKDKKAQQAAARLGKTEDWRILRRFVANLKQELLEATLGSDDLEEIRRFKHIIYATAGIISLPDLVNLVKKVEKEDDVSKREKEEAANRRKFNPGGFLRRVVKKG